MASRRVEEAYRRDRRRLVERLRAAGIEDLSILHAFDAVPRHLFVPEALWGRAYEDAALPIGEGQTISRPGAHALHLSLAKLTGEERVLEVGTGSGFQTALLAELAGEVYSIERIESLSRRAAARLARFELQDVTLRVGDGSLGWPEAAPFDTILVGAAAPEVPGELEEQLAVGGRMVIPIGGDAGQELLTVTRREEGLVRHTVERARFVPLVGSEGW